MPHQNATDAGSLVGRTLGDFLIRERLGEGGMGEVYRAEQVSLQREAVVKVMLGEARHQAIPVQRFMREARLASSLSHPFAAHVYDFGAEPDGLLWIAMEFVRGTPLNKLLKERGAIPLRRLVPFMERLCEVVHSAHEQGIIHRDLKPANVMVLAHAGRYSPKLIDLGIAKRLGDPGGDTPSGGRLVLDHLETPPPQPRQISDDLPTSTLGKIPMPMLSALAAMPVVQSTPSGTHNTFELTSAEHLIGTPAYVAPELWTNPRDASARSDIYSLGVIVFEALVGRRPFPQRDGLALFKAHLGPVPALGEGFSPALQQVIDKALARAPQQRYQTAVELGQGLRDAAGLADDDEAPPSLEEGLREKLVNDFPAPLAEAGAALAASRSMRAFSQALKGLAEVCAWWVGLMSVIPRVERSGEAFAAAPTVKPLLTALHTRMLRADEWLALAVEATAPDAAAPDAHPLPELVALLVQQPHVAATLVALANADPEVYDTATLGERLGGLERALGHLSFLADYAVGVARDGWVESWVGVRPRQRPPITEAPSLPPGQVALLGADGDLMLTLSPWVQALAPNPGAPDELFLLAGSGRHGARLIAPPLNFERYDAALFEELARLGLGAASGANDPNSLQRAPYLGLASFSSDDADHFFGREREAQACANRLRLQGLLAIVGPSGAGKSSFVQAGVRPLLPRAQTFISIRPGPTPLLSLEAKLLQMGLPAADLRARMLADPRTLKQVLKAGAGQGGVLLFVDQFEEVVTLCGDLAERRALAEGLHLASSDADEPIRVVLCLRDDFLMSLKQLPRLGDRLQGNLELIGTPSADDLQRILVEPARRVGFSFEDEALALEMVQSVEQQPGALALLSFTALKLWELRDRKHSQLTRKAYLTLGGVGGALAQHAEATLAGLGEHERTVTREVFRHLVTSVGTRAVLHRSEMQQLLGNQAVGAAVLERLIEARLLVTSEGAGGEDRVEVIHEALLASWPRLVKWQREDAEAARLRDQLRATARQWDGNGRPAGMLWRGDVLAEYRLWQSRGASALTKAEADFVKASLAQERRATRVVRATVLSVVAGLSIGLGVVFHLMQQARDNTLKLFVDQGRTALLAEQPLRALAWLTHAQHEGAKGPLLATLLERGLLHAEGELARLRGSSVQMFLARLSPDQRFVLTGGSDGHVRLFDLTGAQAPRELGVHSADARGGSVSPDGTLAVTASLDHTAVLWVLATGEKRAVLAHPDAVTSGVFTRDGGAVLTSCRDGVARLFSTSNGAPLRTYGQPGSSIHFAWLSPDGRWVLTGGSEQFASLYDTNSGELIRRFEGFTAPMRRGAFSLDSSVVVLSANDHTVRSFEVHTGRALAVIQKRGTNVSSFAISPDGTHVASGTEEGITDVWSTNTGQIQFSARLNGIIFGLAFSPDSHTLAVGSQDGSLSTWDVQSGLPRWRYQGQIEGVYTVAFNADGSRLLTAGLDGTARWWDATLSLSRLSLTGISDPGQTNGATWAAFSADGGQVFAAGRDRRLARWSSGSGALERTNDEAHAAQYDRYRRVQARPSPDGALVAVGTDEAVELRDAESFRLVRRLPLTTGPVKFVAFDHTGASIAAVTVGKQVVVWSVATGEQRWAQSESDEPNAVAFDPVSHRVVTAGEGSALHFYDGSTGQSLMQIPQGNSMESAEFSADGRLVVAGGDDNTARAFDAHSGALVTSFEGHTGHVTRAVFNPAGTLLATAADDSTVRLWDAATGVQLDVLGTHGGAAYSVSWSPNGDELVSSGEDGEARVWRLGPQRLAGGPTLECLVPYQIRGTQLMYVPVSGTCERRP